VNARSALVNVRLALINTLPVPHSHGAGWGWQRKFPAGREMGGLPCETMDLLGRWHVACIELPPGRSS
jgi:hypothetical protein